MALTSTSADVITLLATLGGAGPTTGPLPPEALEAFTYVVAGRVPAELGEADRADIGALAAAASGSRIDQLRMVYDSVGDAGTRAAAGSRIALETIFTLPRPERAAIVMSCVLGMRDDDVGGVLGCSAAQAGALTERSIDFARRLRDTSAA